MKCYIHCSAGGLPSLLPPPAPVHLQLTPSHESPASMSQHPLSWYFSTSVTQNNTENSSPPQCPTVCCEINDQSSGRMCIFMHVCPCRYQTHTWALADRDQRLASGLFFGCSSFETLFQMNLGFTELVSCSELQGSSCLCLPGAGIAGVHLQVSLFT